MKCALGAQLIAYVHNPWSCDHFSHVRTSVFVLENMTITGQTIYLFCRNFQVEIVKEPSRKRLNVEKVEQSSDCVKPKQDSDARDLNEMISFAIVKNEVEDEDYFEDTSGNSDKPPLGKVEHEENTTGELSEMTVSAITFKQECDDM